jgi:hypothetical protein
LHCLPGMNDTMKLLALLLALQGKKKGSRK